MAQYEKCFKSLLYFQLISNSVVALSAILLIAIPQYYYSVLIARFIAGIGHGFAYVAVCQHFGEISIDTQRGRIGTSLHLFMLKGGIISGNVIINYFSVDSRMDPNRFLGICCLFLCCFAILATLTLYKESIVTLIQSSTREDAIKTMMLLQGQFEETAEITDTYNELKMMVSEDKLKSADIFSEGNLKPLIMVLLLRMSFVLSFNFAIKYIHFTLVHDSKPLFDYTFILNFAHTFVVVVVLFTIDRYGRRAHILLSAGATSVVFIIFGCLQAFYSVSALLIFIMLTLFELFSAIGLGLTAHIYSTEAFVTTKKPGSISFTSIIEHCLQIMFVVWVQIVTDAYLLCIILLLISGIVLGFITIYFDRHLPETKNLSIREARNKFLQ